MRVREVVLAGVVVVVGVVLAVLFLSGFSGGGCGVVSCTPKSSTSSISSTVSTTGVSRIVITTTSSMGSTGYLPGTVTSIVTGILTSLPKPTSRLVILRVPRNEYVIVYNEWISYSDGDYSLIRAYWDKYVSLMHDRVLRLYSDAHIVNISIVCLDENNTVKISFLVTDKVWGNSEVTADFLWFLNAWSLDFIDDEFSEHCDGLSWSGVLNGVETTIIVKVPQQPEPYRAWATPYGHCHGHVWWPRR